MLKKSFINKNINLIVIKKCMLKLHIIKKKLLLFIILIIIFFLL